MRILDRGDWFILGTKISNSKLLARKNVKDLVLTKKKVQNVLRNYGKYNLILIQIK